MAGLRWSLGQHEHIKPCHEVCVAAQLKEGRGEIYEGCFLMEEDRFQVQSGAQSGKSGVPTTQKKSGNLWFSIRLKRVFFLTYSMPFS